MSVYDDLVAEVNDIASSKWTSRKGLVVPSESSVTFGHDAVNIEGAVLYADMAASTELVSKYTSAFAATLYKGFLTCCVRMIRHFDGEITAYDGDRVMAVYMGVRARTRATRSALAINFAMSHALNPAIARNFNVPDFYLGHACGVDISDLFVIKTGIRNYDDLAWIGNAANIAAKLSNLREPYYRTYITDDVYSYLADDGKSYNGQQMWEARTWNGRTVYRSSWRLGPLA
jgi:class 3 adenylate cyclase